MSDEARRIGDFWDARQQSQTARRSRWWQSPEILRHINRMVCGEALDGAHAGFHRLLVQRMPPGGFARAVSVGCGTGQKEFQLLRAGIVQEVQLYELSAERIRIGTELAARQNLADRVTFHHADAFAECRQSDFDLVYWNNALHHMFDVEAAIRWSHERLTAGGLFAMDEFIGPSRFQWPDDWLEAIAAFRQTLAPRHLRHPRDPAQSLPVAVRRPSLQGMIAADPSEAADSERILTVLPQVFPAAEIHPTGGVIYHTGLNDVLANLDTPEDAPILQLALLLDQTLSRQGMNQYAVAIAAK